MAEEKSCEQQARDLLEQCGVEDAQAFSAGDVVALANFISDAYRWRDLAHTATDLAKQWKNIAEDAMRLAGQVP